MMNRCVDVGLSGLRLDNLVSNEGVENRWKVSGEKSFHNTTKSLQPPSDPAYTPGQHEPK